VDLPVITPRRVLTFSASAWHSGPAKAEAILSRAVSASKRQDICTPSWYKALAAFSSSATSLRCIETTHADIAAKTAAAAMAVCSMFVLSFRSQRLSGR